jgi:hypothetical protein
VGYLNAYGAAQHAELEQALIWHLTANHYPPVSTEFVPACKQAIQTFVVAAGSVDTKGEDGVFQQLCDTYVDLPNGNRVSVVEVVEQLHLDAFVDQILNEQ